MIMTEKTKPKYTEQKNGQWPVTFSNQFSLRSSHKVSIFKIIHVVLYLVLIGNVDTFISSQVISGISKQATFPKLPLQRNPKKTHWQAR